METPKHSPLCPTSSWVPTFLEGAPAAEELPVGPFGFVASQPMDGGHKGTPGCLFRLEAAGEVRRLRAGWGDANTSPSLPPSGSHQKMSGFSFLATFITWSSVESSGTHTEVE